jgi:ATP-dependent DNA helicase RecG
LVRGKVIFGKEEKFFRSGKRLFRITISDETAELELLWFRYNKPYLSRFTQQGLELMAYGTTQTNRGKRQMLHPDITLLDRNEGKEALGFYPVYPAINRISGQVISSAIRQALGQYQEILADGIPKEITDRLGLPRLGEAIRHVHIPSEESSIELLNQHKTKYHQRLTFDRFFHVMLNIAFRKKSRQRKTGPVFSIPEDMIRRAQECFPFIFTGDQVKVIREIFRDLSSVPPESSSDQNRDSEAGTNLPVAVRSTSSERKPGEGRPMNRLLQGDVGCGKTVVAAAASYAAILNNWQVAIMAPTQVLAQQHYLYFSRLSESMGFHPVLLTGALKMSDRLDAYEKIRSNEYNLIIGTHALIQEDLSFARLGLVVIDEQHRFGVRQRALLDKKGENPHLLIMTATPIPRTLAMTVYADLEISVIKEYPEGHQTVMTYLVDESQKRKVYNTIKQRISEGQQAIVICPVIERPEEMDLKDALQMYEKLKKLFTPLFRVALIHGRLSPHEKDRVMGHFREGLIDILVGTTVIEVGIHAEGATVMVVEHPERFGLTQLHQLRGRVGRGRKRGLCLLMLHKGLQEEALSRLKILVESHNGFEIAQKDLEMRGQGKLMGVSQAGPGELDFTELFRDPELLIAAKTEAERVLEFDPELSSPESHFLREMVESTFAGPSDF